jgi:hypothetical protein
MWEETFIGRGTQKWLHQTILGGSAQEHAILDGDGTWFIGTVLGCGAGCGKPLKGQPTPATLQNILYNR